MKYVIFSDIHGNLQALNSMLDQVRYEAPDGYIFCGDIMGYYYSQAEIISKLKSLNNLILVSGNHDRYYLESIIDRKKRQDYIEKYGKSYEQMLSDEDVRFLKAMPPYKELVIQNRRIMVFHGGPYNYLKQRLYPDTELFGSEIEQYDVIFSGHTHYRMQKTAGNTLIVNPGSLGQPRDKKGYSYSIFDFSAMSNTFFCVRVDEPQLKKELEIRERGSKAAQYLVSRMEMN